MKIRNGFVSNSSSSSFIVAIAKVVDEAKVNSWLKSLKINKYDYAIVKVSDVKLAAKDCYDSLIKTKNEVIISSFQSDARISLDNLTESDKILFINVINNEGDSGRFSGCDEDGEYSDIDYDIDLDYFEDDQIKLYKGLSENNGLANIDKRYGAGRNG
jgi:hypothetical protein